MHVLLSSTASMRYKDDVLRCLSAPMGAEIQFRYRHEGRGQVSQQVLQDIQAKQGQEIGEGIVCFVDRESTNALTIIPIRIVNIHRAFVIGGIVTVRFTLGDFAFADPVSFTSHISTSAVNSNPTKDADGTIRGNFFFKIPTKPNALTTGRTIDHWERTVRCLWQNRAFKDEPFFHSILGFQQCGKNTLDPNLFHAMPTQLAASKLYEMFIYHYHPENMPATRFSIRIEGGGDLNPASSQEVIVDSSYDLKHWQFRGRSNTPGTYDGWVTIRTPRKSNPNPDEYWDLELPVKFVGSKIFGILKGLLIGALISGSYMSAASKDLTCLGAVLSIGLSSIAGIIIVFNIQTPDTKT